MARNARLPVLAALGLASLALRPQLTGIGPLLPAVQDDLDVSHLVLGLLPAIPVVCMGVFAPPAAYVAARLGARAAIALCLALVGGFGLARILVPGVVPLVALTFPIGVGMGLAGALMPVAIKERFADRPAFATGVYATGLNLGSAIAAPVAVPIAAVAWGWRAPLAAFSAATLVLVAVWLALTPRAARSPFTRPPRLPLRRATGWLLVLLFALDSMVFYGLNAWLPDVYVEHGWSEAAAGNLLGVLHFSTILTSLAVPWLADRAGSRRLYLVASAVLLLAGALGIVLLPGGGYAWAAIAGLAIGAIFPIMLTLPLDLADRPADVGAFAGLMLGGGYVLAALAPPLLGALRDASGGFAASLWLLVLLSAGLVAVSLQFSAARLAHRAPAHGEA